MLGLYLYMLKDLLLRLIYVQALEIAIYGFTILSNFIYSKIFRVSL